MQAIWPGFMIDNKLVGLEYLTARSKTRGPGDAT